MGGLHPRVAGPIERAVVVFISAVLQSLSFLLVGVSASAAVQRYVFAHATAEFVDVTFFVVLGALFTATTQTIVPRRDLTTLSGTRVASVLTLMPVATLLSISNGVGRLGSGGARVASAVLHDDPLRRREFALLRYPIAHCVADARPIVLLRHRAGRHGPPADSWVQVEGVPSSRELPGRSG
jgi:hypothetical protein